MIPLSPRRGALFAGATALGLVAGGMAASLPAFGSERVRAADGFGPGDGLHRYVVGLADGAAPADVAAHEDVDSIQPLTGGGSLVATTLTRAQVAALPGVASAEPSAQAEVFGSVDPTDPDFARYGWNLRNTGSNAYGQDATAGADTGAVDAWAVTRGAGTVVAVVDTGYDSDHPDLAGALWTNPEEACGKVDADGDGKAGDCHGWNFVKNSADVDNGSGGGHGTAVSGAVAARADNAIGSAGVAPSAKIMPLVVGTGGKIDTNLGIEAIRYAADHGADVVNASWGGDQTSTDVLRRMDAAIAYAASKGVLVVAAAGNDSRNREASPVYPASSTEPGLVVVGASTATDAVSGYSGYGATTVDLFAPGDRVRTTSNDGSHEQVSGTSVAAPQVAAAIALRRSLEPEASAATLKAETLAATTPIAAMRTRSVSGGRLDLDGLTPSGQSVTYSFSSMDARPGTASPQVALRSTVSRGTYAVELGLATRVGGRTWAVADHEVTLDGTTASTDDRGRVRFSLGEGDFLRDRTLVPTLDLGAGTYALSVQVLLDGSPLGRPWAAPLRVGDELPITGPDAPATPGTPVDPTPGVGGPGAGGPRAPKVPGSAPDAPGTPPGGGRTTPSTPPTAPRVPGTAPTGSGSAPSTPGGQTPTGAPTPPAGDRGGSQTATPVPGPAATPGQPTRPGTTPGTPTPGTTSPVVVPPPSSVTSPGTAPAQDGGRGTPGGTRTYPSTGDFAITSVSPLRVPSSGGTQVVVTGSSIPADAKVRVGLSGQVPATVSGNTLTFTAPARPSGVVDVVVYSTGRSSTLAGALEYHGGAGSTPAIPVVAAPPPSAGPGPAGGTMPAPSGPSAGPGAGSTPTPAPPVQPSTAVGPNGEHLVFDPALSDALEGVWASGCRSTCSGVQV